jgi:hypothetical protein
MEVILDETTSFNEWRRNEEEDGIVLDFAVLFSSVYDKEDTQDRDILPRDDNFLVQFWQKVLLSLVRVHF